MRVVALAFALALASAACGDDGQSSPGATSARDAAGGAARTYDQTTAGLTAQIEDLLSAVRAGDEARVATLTGALEPTDAKVWFTQTFGEALGMLLYENYQPVAGQFDQLGRLLEGLIESGQTNVKVEVYERAGDPSATGYQNLALAAMKLPTPLYSVRFVADDESTGFHLWSFVYDGGGFRWVGKMKGVSSGTPDDPDLLELRIRLAQKLQVQDGDK